MPYLSEHVGNPYVFTIDISNPDEVTETIMKTRNLEVSARFLRMHN